MKVNGELRDLIDFTGKENNNRYQSSYAKYFSRNNSKITITSMLSGMSENKNSEDFSATPTSQFYQKLRGCKSGTLNFYKQHKFGSSGPVEIPQSLKWGQDLKDKLIEKLMAELQAERLRNEEYLNQIMDQGKNYLL